MAFLWLFCPVHRSSLAWFNPSSARTVESLKGSLALSHWHSAHTLWLEDLTSFFKDMRLLGEGVEVVCSEMVGRVAKGFPFHPQGHLTRFLRSHPKSPTGWNDKSAVTTSESVHQRQSEHVDVKLMRMSELGKSQHASKVSHAFSALILLALATRRVSTNKAFLASFLLLEVLQN